MKQIILVLGLIASTGFTICQISDTSIDPSKSPLNQSSNELQISLNYEGTNEDGEREGIGTDR